MPARPSESAAARNEAPIGITTCAGTPWGSPPHAAATPAAIAIARALAVARARAGTRTPALRPAMRRDRAPRYGSVWERQRMLQQHGGGQCIDVSFASADRAADGVDGSQRDRG